MIGQLAPGQYEIAVKPVEIKGGELMRLFYVSDMEILAYRK